MAAPSKPNEVQYDLDKLKEQAQAWLKDEEGESGLFKQLLEDMIVAYQIEVVEGQHPRDLRSGPTSARQSRKQQKELAELILELVQTRRKK